MAVMAFTESDARTMIDNFLFERREELEEMHPAFSIRAKEPYVTAVPVDDDLEEPDPSDEPRVSGQDLAKINNYLDRVSREVRAGVDVKSCTWDDVLGKLRDADEAVAQRMDHDAKLLSKVGTLLANMGKMIQPALDAIPDEACVLHGGLALVLHLAKGRDKAKQDIVGVFEDVAHTFAIATDAVDHFPTDTRLHQALYKLRSTLLGAIPSLVSILVPRNLLAKLVAPFRTYKVDRLVDMIRNDTRRVQNRTRNLADHHQLESTKQVEEIHHGVVGLQEGFQDLEQRVQMLVKYSLASRDDMYKMLSACVEAFNCRKLEEQERKTRQRPNEPARRRSSAMSPSADGGKILSMQHILNVNALRETQDLGHVRRQEQQFDARSKESVASIMTHVNFQRWMTSDKPDFVHIEGKLEKWYGNTSPISYFCANLVRKLKDFPPTTATLHYFCGQHVASNDPLRGPRGLMRSLISQLLRVWPWISLDEISLEGIHHESAIPFHDLCHLFQMIADQVPHRHTIMCIIDDINRLERDEWAEDYVVLMDMLGHMVSGSDEDQNDEEDLRFKVLITSPNQSRWLRDENRVDEAHRVLVTDSGSACR